MDNKGDLEKIFQAKCINNQSEALTSNEYWNARIYNELVSYLNIDICLTYLEGDL